MCFEEGISIVVEAGKLIPLNLKIISDIYFQNILKEMDPYWSFFLCVCSCHNLYADCAIW